MAKKAVAGVNRSVWLKPDKSVRGAPVLTLEKIVLSAVHILDRNGQSGLTMRNLANHLDAGAASLYWHVETRDEVLELALDHVIGEVILPEQEIHWQLALTQHLQDWRVVMLQHPWAPRLIGLRPLLGPNALERSEYLRALLESIGLSNVEANHAGYTLSNFMIGSVITQSAWRSGGNAEQLNYIADFLDANAEKYPHLSVLMGCEDVDWDKSFAKGLEWIIHALPV